MKIFIDSADIDEIREAYSWGIVDGITTNPSLIKKAVDKARAAGESRSMHDLICRILEAAGETPVSLEVIGTTEATMTAQGFFLHETFQPVAGNVVVKIPVNPVTGGDGARRYDGLKAIRTLSQAGIPVNTTLIFTPEQALLAAKAGAAYVSPFAGRIDDLLRKRLASSAGRDAYYPRDGERDEQGKLRAEDDGIVSGVDLVARIVDVFHEHGFECEVLAASIRNPRQARECALAGADVATIPFEVIRDMIDHPKTVEGMVAFIKDVVPEYARLLPEGG
jgi:transaldolase